MISTGLQESGLRHHAVSPMGCGKATFSKTRATPAGATPTWRSTNSSTVSTDTGTRLARHLEIDLLAAATTQRPVGRHRVRPGKAGLPHGDPKPTTTGPRAIPGDHLHRRRIELHPRRRRCRARGACRDCPRGTKRESTERSRAGVGGHLHKLVMSYARRSTAVALGALRVGGIR